MSMINLKSKKSILCLDFSDLEGLSVIAKEKNKQYLEVLVINNKQKYFKLY